MINKKLKWKTKVVRVADIKPTPKNYKIQTELGRKRLQHSLKTYGLAGALVVNTDLTLIDGNSRWHEAKEAGEKTIEVSFPNRRLTPKEFKEMSAMIDYAKAGEIDETAIEQDLGDVKDFHKNWGREVPLERLAAMGKKSPKDLEYVEEVKGKKAAPASAIKMVQFFFNEKQEAEFRKMEEVLKKRFKLESTTDVGLKAYRTLTSKK